MFSHHMSYYDVAVALSQASLKKTLLSRAQWDSLSRSFQNPLLKTLLNFYPLPKESQEVITQTLQLQRTERQLREGHNNFVSEDIHNTIYSGVAQRTKSYLLQQFAVAPSDNLFHDLEIVVRSGLTDPLIQKELLIAEKDRYDRRLQSYENKLLLTIEPKHTLEEITADFLEYIDYLKETYKAKSTYGWPVLAALILRLSRINEGPDKIQALMTLIRGLDDARTSYHNMPSKHVKNKNYSCQKGFEEFLLISHYEILPGHREAASTTEALILAITEPFVQRLGAEDGCRQTFSQLLYHIYLEAAGYEVRNEKKEFYVLSPGKSKQFLKNKYLSRFATPALKKIHEARFDSLYAQLCQQLIEVSASQISIIDYLLEENALKIECRIDHFLVCNHPEKTENEIFEHMVKRGPFIDKAHLKTVLALIDQQASLKTLQICGQLQTYPAVNIEPLAKHEMQQRYKEYLERQGFQVMHDFYW